MLTSELVSQLNKILATEGDLPVRIRDNDSDWVLPVKGVASHKGRVWIQDTGYLMESAREEQVREGGIRPCEPHEEEEY